MFEKEVVYKFLAFTNEQKVIRKVLEKGLYKEEEGYVYAKLNPSGIISYKWDKEIKFTDKYIVLYGIKTPFNITLEELYANGGMDLYEYIEYIAEASFFNPDYIKMQIENMGLND